MQERERGSGLFEPRAVALYLTGFSAFIGLYLPQSILPVFGSEFGVEPRTAALLISATILGIALASPLVGAVSDRFGRKRLLVTGSLVLTVASVASALAPGFSALLGARFLLGLFLPTLMAVGIAYVSESLPPAQMRAVAGVYVAFMVSGGMLSRVLGGLLADTTGWRSAFGFSALLYLALVPLWIRQPAMPVAGPVRSFAQVALGTLDHLRNRTLIGGLLVGFFLFFAFQSTFSYLPFHLQQPPFGLSSTLVGLTYLTYSAGILSSSFAGWFSARNGLRGALVIGFLIAIGGNLVGLIPSLPVLVAGLFVLCFGNFLVQGLAVGYVATSADHDRAGANALYLLLYYLGGSLGAYVPGFVYPSFGYGGVLTTSVLALLAGLTSAVLLTGKPRN